MQGKRPPRAHGIYIGEWKNLTEICGRGFLMLPGNKMAVGNFVGGRLQRGTVLSEHGYVLSHGEFCPKAPVLKPVLIRGIHIFPFQHRYDGEFSRGLLHGDTGTLYHYDTEMPTKAICWRKIYSGSWREGYFHGRGSLWRANQQKLIYMGAFSCGQMCGKGVRYYESSDGDSEGRRPFHCLKTSQLAARHEGFFLAGLPHGSGTSFFGPAASGNIMCKGNFKDGMAHGQVEVFNEKGALIYSGDCKLGYPCGFGRRFWPRVEVEYWGTFSDDDGSPSGSGTVILKGMGERSVSGNFKNGTLDRYLESFEWPKPIFDLIARGENNSLQRILDTPDRAHVVAMRTPVLLGFHTPLHAAAIMGNLGALIMLMEAGADSRATDVRHEVALSIARRCGNMTIAAVLEQMSPAKA